MNGWTDGWSVQHLSFIQTTGIWRYIINLIYIHGGPKNWTIFES